MRKLVVSEFMTVDGVMQAPGGPEEDTEGGFRHGGWQGPYFDDEVGESVDQGIARTGGFLLGRKTYDIFASYWPNATEDQEFAPVMNEMPKYVASTTLRAPLEWQNSTLLEGDLEEAVRRLKEEDGKDLRVLGSGRLAGWLGAHGLVDEYHLMIHPVVLGGGKRLFEDGGPLMPLRLVDSTTTSKGNLILTYERRAEA
ncbi:MAG TPA: dihydrofolate reductase family protein [Actinomycetota bacterium]|nr:dihydrofolate reductase family protein [Actinomycetota bacterium]